ncbi:hypothetical protein Nepgr_019361 [Nepenthes gracilis]|uniref:Uncharacterized protein n=1 Tax=Nepenthes gracilis TaxID=150966 RepID=A0AAD3XV57_NEPGR|nr:hypothetical protein Nepgr_019361 [Nepenthes gracilis]
MLVRDSLSCGWKGAQGQWRRNTYDAQWQLLPELLDEVLLSKAGGFCRLLVVIWRWQPAIPWICRSSVSVLEGDLWSENGGGRVRREGGVWSVGCGMFARASNGSRQAPVHAAMPEGSQRF